MPGAGKKEVYFMAIIDILTHYDAKKKAAHAAKTVKHGVSVLIHDMIENRHISTYKFWNSGGNCQTVQGPAISRLATVALTTEERDCTFFYENIPKITTTKPRCYSACLLNCLSCSSGGGRDLNSEPGTVLQTILRVHVQHLIIDSSPISPVEPRTYFSSLSLYPTSV